MHQGGGAAGTMATRHNTVDADLSGAAAPASPASLATRHAGRKEGLVARGARAAQGLHGATGVIAGAWGGS